MKNTKTLLTLLAGALVSTAAYAQVELTITGSTAFRSITVDRCKALYDAGSLQTYVFDPTVNTETYTGTMSNKTTLGSTPVKLHLSFSGSGSGMLAVKNSTAVVTASENPGGVPTVNKVPDLALSDVFPGSAGISASFFDPENKQYLGVIPFVYVKNNGATLAGVTNITRGQAIYLMTASGSVGNMPISYLDGNTNHTGFIYMTGRDSGSGTRICVEKCIRFTGTPFLYGTNGTSSAYLTDPDFKGYSSGGLERNLIASKPDAIGYLGRGDLAAIAGSASGITYSGVPYSTAAVEYGSYELWGYEHMVNRVGGLSTNQRQVRNALFAAITDPVYQATPIYALNFEPVAGMHVERVADGVDVQSLDF